MNHYFQEKQMRIYVDLLLQLYSDSIKDNEKQF